MRWIKPIALLALALFVAGVALYAQTDFAVGSILKGFKVPQRDKEGNMKTMLMGDQATVISNNQIRVDGLKIELYSGGVPQTVITSPSSDYWRIEQQLTTERGVLVTHPGFMLQAKTMDWELNQTRGIFTGQVKVSFNKKELGNP